MNIFESIIVFIVTAFTLLYIFTKIKYFITHPSEITGRAGQNIVDFLFTITILILCIMHINSFIKYTRDAVVTNSYYGNIMIIVGIYIVWMSLNVRKRQRRMMADAKREEYQDEDVEK